MSIGGNINVNFLFDDVESGETIVTNLLSLLGKVQELSYYDREIDETIILEGQTNIIHNLRKTVSLSQINLRFWR